jgi:hypothetical protein
MTTAERIQEALELVRRFVGTTHEDAARAYLAAQVELAKRCAHATVGGGAMEPKRDV